MIQGKRFSLPRDSSNVCTKGFCSFICSGLLRRADLRQNVRARRNSRISARRSNPKQNPLVVGTNIGTIPKNMLTNFELKQLKPKLDIVKKPENQVHELTDSNV